jgi:hypothetical protein
VVWTEIVGPTALEWSVLAGMMLCVYPRGAFVAKLDSD